MDTQLSPWWRRALILLMISGFSALGYLAARTYQDAPPIPARVIDPDGTTLFTRQDVTAGQQVFLSHGLMENGSIWGHGAYLGPDFSAEYLHTMALGIRASALAATSQNSGGPHPSDPDAVDTEVARTLKQNRYDPAADTLSFTQAQADSFHAQQGLWRDYFAAPGYNGGLAAGLIQDPDQLHELTAFFAWAAWASAAQPPGKTYSYTNNFPYDPLAGNVPTSGAVLWSAMSLLMLLGGIAVVLFAFGRFNFLGWNADDQHPASCCPISRPRASALRLSSSSWSVLLFLAQVLVGGGVAHYRADPASFYGFDLSRYFSQPTPSHLASPDSRSSGSPPPMSAGGLFLAAAAGRTRSGQAVPRHQPALRGLVVVVFGSLLGEWLGYSADARESSGSGSAIRDGNISISAGPGSSCWHRYFSLGCSCSFRAVAAGPQGPRAGRAFATLFLLAGLRIPALLPARPLLQQRHQLRRGRHWRFWIIHLWVEGFFELFVTVMVAVLFYQLGHGDAASPPRASSTSTPSSFSAGGIIGTGHHWYWTGQTSITMALAAIFSALEVVPLTLLTLDAWDFIKLSSGTLRYLRQSDLDPAQVDLLLPDGGGFLELRRRRHLRLSDQPADRQLLRGRDHPHAEPRACGVHGRLRHARRRAHGLRLRQVLTRRTGTRVEKYVRVSFWGLNIGLAS